MAGDTHAEECHNALQLKVHTVYFIFGTTYLIETLQSYITKAASYSQETKMHYTKIKQLFLSRAQVYFRSNNLASFSF